VKHQTKHSQKQIGTTILEVALGISVTSVLATAAVPSMENLIRSRHLAPTTNDLVATMNLARSEAITRGTRVAVIAKDNGSWSNGWQMFADTNNNGVLDAGEQVIRDYSASAPGLTITPHFGITYPGTVLSYESTGRLARPGGQGLVLGRLSLAQGGDVRTLCFASTRLRVVKALTCS